MEYSSSLDVIHKDLVRKALIHVHESTIYGVMAGAAISS